MAAQDFPPSRSGGQKAGQAGTMRAALNTNPNANSNTNTNTNPNTDTNTGFSGAEVRRAKKEQSRLAQ